MPFSDIPAELVAIPDATKDMAFRPCVQGSGAASGLGLGLGLGLKLRLRRTICRQIANRHGAILAIHDKVVNGCCMVLRLPVRLPPSRHRTG